jgi:hypothetical protein
MQKISMKKPRGLAAAAAALALAGLLGSCGSTDVVGKVAGTSFNAVAQASAGRVSYADASASWRLGSEAGDEVLFASSFAAGAGDVEFSFDAAPFLAAGLDPAKLAAPAGIAYAAEGGRLKIRFDLGAEAFGASAKDSLGAAFAEILRTHRDRIGYHEALDHYGIKLGDGNLFEWAKDMSKNDKDIVWVLNPAPFIAAGADPAKISGWVFGKVEVVEGGKKSQVDKLLKPFNLR